MMCSATDVSPGLDSTINSYHTNFLQHEINGKRLLILDHHDLKCIGVLRLGHQEAILEALELLLFIVSMYIVCLNPCIQSLIQRCKSKLNLQRQNEMF